MSQGVDVTQDANQLRRRAGSGVWRWVRRLVLGVAVVLGVGAAAVQMVLWTDFPRRLVISRIRQELGLEVGARSMTTGWGGYTTLHDVTLVMPLSGDALLRAPSLRVKHTALILLLLGKSIDIDAMDLDQPVLYVRQDPSGAWNVQQTIDLVGRTAGAGQARPAGAASGPLLLPDLRVSQGRVEMTSNSGRHATVWPVNISGWREGTLLYKYDADLGAALRLVGEMATGSAWDHEARFEGHDLEGVLSPLVAGTMPEGINAKGVWRGRLASEGFEGRVMLESFSAAQWSGGGAAAVYWGDSKLQIRPEALTVRSAKFASEPARLIAGTITLDGQGVRAEGLQIEAFKGQVMAGGQWSRFDRSIWFYTAWRGVVALGGASHSGTLHASVQMPWPGRPRIDASLDGAAQIGQNTLAATLHIAGQGDSLQSIDWTTTVQKMSWSGRRSLSAHDVIARWRSRGRQIFLDDVSSAGHAPLTVRGQIDLGDNHWWLWAQGTGIALPGTHLAPLGFDLNTWGDMRYVQVEDLYFRTGDLNLAGCGYYDSRLPKPVNLDLWTDHLPLGVQATMAQLVRGELNSHVQLAGKVKPLQLDVNGRLNARGLYVNGRALGDIDAKLSGSADPERLQFQTTELRLLGGDWRIAGEWPGDQRQPLKVRAAVQDLLLAEAGQLAKWPEIKGTVNGAVTMQLKGASLHAVDAQGVIGASDLAVKSLPAQQARASFGMHDGVLKIDPIELWQGAGVASGKIEWNADLPAKWDLTASARDWPLEFKQGQIGARVEGQSHLRIDLSQGSAAGPIEAAAHLLAGERPLGQVRAKCLMEPERAVVQRLEADALGGSAYGSANVSLADLTESTADLDWRGIDLAEVSAWLPKLAGLIGRCSGQARMRPVEDVHALGPMRLDTSLRVNGGQYRGMKVGNGSFTTYFDHDRIVMANSSMELADGSATLFARATRRAGEPILSLASIQFKGLDLDQIVHAVEPEAHAMPGRAQGQFTLGGDPRRVEGLFGAGELRLTESELVNFAPIGAVYDLMHIAGGRNGQPTGTATVLARLENRNLSITSARVFNRGVEVRGLGTIQEVQRLPDSPISGVVVGSARPLQSIKLPFMADVDKILSVLQTNLTTARVSGTLRKPQAAPATFAEIGQAMRTMLLGDVSDQTKGSAH